ncbi:uncharacterized protein LOC143842409 isoform X2 [Paroedura picta]|uniref:uncharacterized protein LOC143842409 isoform X2 n=1 Tax=Paroedura picta TaxID=143630 RepID=UPI004055DE06
MEEKLILGVHTGLLTLPLVHFTTRTTKLQLSELTTSSVPTALQPFRNDLSLSCQIWIGTNAIEEVVRGKSFIKCHVHLQHSTHRERKPITGRSYMESQRKMPAFPQDTSTAALVRVYSHVLWSNHKLLNSSLKVLQH